MFTAFFEEKSLELKSKLKKRLSIKNADENSPTQRWEIFRDLYSFFEETLPNDFHIGPGKVRSKTHLLPRSADMILYKKWCKNLVEMCGGWHLVQNISAICSVETNLSTQQLINHMQMTQAVKTLYARSAELGEKDFIPMSSVLFAYDNKIPLISHQKAIYDHQKEKQIPMNCEIDLVIILDQAIIMKDWDGGQFKVIETGKDTLLWGYILMLEYLGLDRSLNFPAREYIKRTEAYVEY